MFEAKLPQAVLLKKVLEALTGLIDDATFDCDDEGLCLQVNDAWLALFGWYCLVGSVDGFACDY